MNTTINTTIEKLSSFDPYFMYSDDSRKYDQGNRDKREITELLDSLTPNELREVKEGLTVSMEFVDVHFKTYFENLPTTKEPKTSFRSEIMSAAWDMIKRGVFSTLSQALTAAWKRYKLTTKLRAGVAYFSFVKATGELRQAIGTLRNGNFNYTPKTNMTETNFSIIKYFDLEKRAFRSVRIDRLIEIAA